MTRPAHPSDTGPREGASAAPPEEGQTSAFSIPPVLFFVAVLLFIALLNGRSDLILLSLMVLSLFGGAYLISRASFRQLEWRVQVDREKIFPGETATLSVHLTNAKFLPVWVKVRFVMNQRAGFSAQGAASRECGLLWHQQVRFRWPVTASRRGVHTLGSVSIQVADPLGLYPREKSVLAPRMVVFPRIVEVKPLDIPRRDVFGLPGRRSPVKDPVYLLGTQDYRSGLPARFIHWKASARHHRLQEKIFDPSEQEKVLMAVDVESFAACEDFQALERTLEVVASVAVALDKRGSAFGFAGNAEMTDGARRTLPVAGRGHQISALLDLLAHIRPASGMALKAVLTGRTSFPGGICALVFVHAVAPPVAEWQTVFAMRRIPVVLVVADERVETPAQNLSLHSILSLKRLGGSNGRAE